MRFLLLLCGWVLPILLSAQVGVTVELWTLEPPSARAQQASERRIEPQVYQVFSLDMEVLRNQLANAPLEGSPAARNQPLLLKMPLPNGDIVRVGVWESPMMAADLAARYPSIRTYSGRALDVPGLTLRFDLTPQGFHAMLMTPSFGTVFIDPLYHGQDQLYQVYAKKDFVAPAYKTFTCAFDNGHAGDPTGGAPAGSKLLGDCQLRTYRLALACTGEYAAFHGGTVPLVLGAMVTTMNRVNGVYEREFAVRMNIVSNNDTLIFLDPATDPFTNEDVGAMLVVNHINAVRCLGNNSAGSVSTNRTLSTRQY